MILNLQIITLTFCLILTAGCARGEVGKGRESMAEPEMKQNNSDRAIFAGGCFWCMEKPFEELPGVIRVVAGYTGGNVENPTYEEVSSGQTGHREAVEITFDPAKISYFELLDVFWKQIDPTDAGGQFNDRGDQYRSAVYYLNEQQRDLAEKSKKKLQDSGRFDKPILTEILPAGAFYSAEDDHQDYYLNNSFQYKFYRLGSGRDAFLRKAWENQEP